MQTKIRIVFTFIICHLISYFIVSVPYYQFVMKVYYVGEQAVFPRFLITENHPALWAQAMNFFFPLQILNALLFSVLIILVLDWLKKQPISKVFFFVFWSKGVISGISAISPAPGTIEGILFFIPEVTSSIHLLVIIEILLQAVVVSLSFVILNKKIWNKEK